MPSLLESNTEDQFRHRVLFFPSFCRHYIDTTSTWRRIITNKCDMRVVSRGWTPCFIGCVVLQALVAALPLTGVINSYSYGPFGCDFSMTATDPGGRFFVIFRALQGQWFKQLIVTSIRWIKVIIFPHMRPQMNRYLRCPKIISVQDLHVNFKMMSYFLYSNIL